MDSEEEFTGLNCTCMYSVCLADKVVSGMYAGLKKAK